MSDIEETKKKIAIMQAFVDGEDIEVLVRISSTGYWHDLSEMSIASDFTWREFNYRIKLDRLTELLTEAHEHVMTPKSKWIADAREAHRVHNMLLPAITFKEVEQRATELFGPCPEDVEKSCETCANSMHNNSSGVCFNKECRGISAWEPKK